MKFSFAKASEQAKIAEKAKAARAAQPVAKPQGGIIQPRQALDGCTPSPTVEPGANPELPAEGVARYARIFDAMRRLEDAGFEDQGLGGEMVSLSGRFASIKPLDKTGHGPCEVRIRRARHRG